MAKVKIIGSEHWTHHGGADLYMWRKRRQGLRKPAGSVILVHGSSMASTPSFDLTVPGRPGHSLMDYLAERNFDVWTVDHEGYGRSTKDRKVHAGIKRGAEDLLATAKYIRKTSGAKSFLMYGISSGALRAALFAQKYPQFVKRVILDAFVWTGKGSPTLKDRAKKFATAKATDRRAIHSKFIRTIFSRDKHAKAARPDVIKAFAEACCELDDSVPNGTYIDMTRHLPVINPRKLTVPVLITRGEWDGIASYEDLIEFFNLLPNPDKQFAVMPGISHASLQMKNFEIVFHLIGSYFSQPDPVFKG
ncbi:MAG: alpha/beta fold hydrolase [Nitrospinaceae bacterium]|jgi:pimeloyl-ACP methyl ester carboxylesterase|nr:alpha/beta fold hydrolase [Nitrospinaceae bacterium]MBT3821672.1 alpha/beta fold hydrolase [Nitrospinaceae bacterium]MBT4093820.1 alpha/beta fold hydrolase [Nitrospinaceae bacterium]MBT4429210.1 alpha/beta fold hydrolase [Nitrospinaceae bacterium]MBT5367079.1 alpha/beta fold hydrolase [Nitrospinaceae bacterium]